MKPSKILLLLFTFFISLLSVAQTSNNVWTWLKGDDAINVSGVYGNQRVAAPGNNPGGRQNSSTWRDANGTLWLFGGYGYTNSGTGYLSDLWKYDRSNNDWTWVNGDSTINAQPGYGTKGVASPMNNPGARHFSGSWVDNSGDLWLFGGLVGSNSEYANDLWKYDPATNEWTWMNGDSTLNVQAIYGIQREPDINNKPGGRYGIATWTDAANNLWLFGGTGYGVTSTPGQLNDVWKYYPSINQWAWMKGNTDVDVRGVYGSIEIPDILNNPGGRNGSACVVDNTGEVWIFGGNGFDYNSNQDKLNDLWKFSPLTNNWTWINGDNTIRGGGVYGTAGISSPSNKPGARLVSSLWKDAIGNLWLFGGQGFSASGSGYMNDLWKYDITNNQWAWISGDNIENTTGMYGRQGVQATTNKPGGRDANIMWSDGTGNAWLFGGGGYSSSASGSLNDLWEFSPMLTLPISLININASIVQKNVLVNWQTSQEINTDRFVVQRSFNGVDFVSLDSVRAAGNSRTTKNYSFTDQRPGGTNQYRLKIIDMDGKFSFSKIVTVKFNSTGTLQIFPNPTKDILFVQFNGDNSEAKIQVTDAFGRKLKEQKITLNGITSVSVDVKDLPKGVYTVSIITNTKIEQQKFVKQ